MFRKLLPAIPLVLALQTVTLDEAQAQTVNGVRGINGGVGSLFNLVGPGSLYTDHQGTMGYMYSPIPNFESYNFNVPNGLPWTGAVMTLGPQLTIGLIQGANQATGQATVFPPAPRQPLSPPPVTSTLLDEIP